MHLADEDVSALEAAARAYSQSGDLTNAITAMTKLTTLSPQSWQYALNLALALRKSGQTQEAEHVHRRAALRFPKEFWVMYHWAESAMHDQNLALAEQRALKLLIILEQIPEDRRATLRGHAAWLLGTLALKRHAFAEAILHFTLACAQAPGDAARAACLRQATRYEKIAASFDLSPLTSSALAKAADYGVLVVNLDRDVQRFEVMTERFKDSPVTLTRVPGTYGSYLPKVLLRAMNRHAGTLRAGSTGCFLGHIKAWETMVELNLPVCLILEDDAAPMLNLPPRFAALGIPDDFDLCFVNRAMQPELSDEHASEIERFAVFDPIEAFRTRPPTHNAPGGYGYFLSAEGARKLLALVAQNGFSGDVDWVLCIYGMAKGAAEILPEDSTARHVFKSSENFKGERLRAYTLYPSLIEHVYVSSEREIEDAALNRV
jgi:GR25 family glycosyltransferase involved in LPS biosynthesis